MHRQLYRRMIVEFTFDGSLVRFRTLVNRETQTRSSSAIVQVREWRSRYGRVGYRIVFRDGALVYLDDAIPNATSLGEQLRSLVDLSKQIFPI
jgi:hypothetical protein